MSHFETTSSASHSCLLSILTSVDVALRHIAKLIMGLI